MLYISVYNSDFDIHTFVVNYTSHCKQYYIPFIMTCTILDSISNTHIVI